MDKRRSCPLGHECESIKTDPDTKKQYIDQCMWLERVRGTHPQTGQEVDKTMCAVNALVVGIFDNSKTMRSLTAGVESNRNRTAEAVELLQKIPVKDLLSDNS